MAADSSFEGLSLDPSKGGKMSLEKKRELVYEISNWPEGASEILQSWSRQEILQILCSEMGKERKYTGLTKLKIIEHLLKIVSEKKSSSLSSAAKKKSNEDAIDSETTAKRQRKTEQPSRLASSTSNATKIVDLTTSDAIVYCKNSACKATLSLGDVFCKRCSCCDCFKYDDNKDPSLWLICGSEPPFQGLSCGMSCHLECALKREASGISLVGKPGALDGSFQCLSCRKVNDLLGCWRKQFLIAKETRRVDILCYRVSLSQKLLRGTVKYEKLYEIVGEAVKKLESEVGPLTGLPAKMGRGIVNRLSSGPEVQKLCGSALDLLDFMFSKPTFHTQPGSSSLQVSEKKSTVPDTIKFEEVRPTSITVILDSENAVSQGNNLTYKLWHRKSDDANYPRDPTCENLRPNTGFRVEGLDPGMDYCFNVISFDGANELIKKLEARYSTTNEESLSPVTTNCSSLSNPSSVEDETNNDGSDPIDDPVPVEAAAVDKGKSAAEELGTECVPFVARDLPITPCKLERSKPAGKDLVESGPGNGKRDLEYYVKIIRWLECEGHIEKNFRQKFLTWYSLRATRQEVQIVKVFVDTLVEEPASLAAQLVDTFSESVSSSSRLNSSSTNGFCMKLWH